MAMNCPHKEKCSNYLAYAATNSVGNKLAKPLGFPIHKGDFQGGEYACEIGECAYIEQLNFDSKSKNMLERILNLLKRE